MSAYLVSLVAVLFVVDGIALAAALYYRSAYRMALTTVTALARDVASEKTRAGHAIGRDNRARQQLALIAAHYPDTAHLANEVLRRG